MCGLLVDRTEELARLYREHGSWNQVKQVWFDEWRSNRSTRGSAQKIFRVLTSRLQNPPGSLPAPSELPDVLDACATTRDKAQVVYLYLVADDPLVRYVVEAYSRYLTEDVTNSLDFSNSTLTEVLDRLEYEDGSSFDYADSTTVRWCEGFRSVMREIGVLEDQQAVTGSSPSTGDVPLLVAMGYSYEEGGDDWLECPIGLCYLFQAGSRWEEQFDRVGATDDWEFVELHGSLELRPVDGTYDWVGGGD
ncbi:hypothetical protein L593_06330 [Salinarchaeum sp. Harcht-Bsk1]|nr:hypothetical protein L593_06330 [Salinarchaeum sp. Harcht-Bsk1]